MPLQTQFPANFFATSVDRNAYVNKITDLWDGDIISYIPLWESQYPYAYDSVNDSDGTYSSSGLTYSQTGIGDGRTSVLFDGTAGNINMYTSDLQTAFNGQEGSFSCWMKVTNSGVWSDATVRSVLFFRVNASNFLQITKSSTTGRFEWTHVSGGVQKQRRRESSTETGWVHIGVTWSLANNRFRCYWNGVQVGATLTTLGTWSGTVSSSNMYIGTSNPSGTLTTFWKGNLAHCVFLDREATPAEMADAAVIPVSVSSSVSFNTGVTTINLASGGDIAAAISTMRGGNILELEAGGTYTIPPATMGFGAIPSGYSNLRTIVKGNGATVSGGTNAIYLLNKSYVDFENLNVGAAQSWSCLVTQCNNIRFTDCDFYNPATGLSFDCWRSDNSSFVTVTRCSAHSTTNFDSTRAHDGFELWGPCNDFEFVDCIAYDIKNGATDNEGHGFEVYGQQAGEECDRVYFRGCEAYNCMVGFSIEGGPTDLSHSDNVCIACSSHDNQFYGYQGVNNSTLYREEITGTNNTGNGVSETNASVVDR